jgi:starch phosphorylase
MSKPQLTKENLNRVAPERRLSQSSTPPGSRTPSLHQPAMSRRSSISAAGPNHAIDTTQIGVPTPRRPKAHQRSLTGSYFPSAGMGGKVEDESPIGDPKVWKEALKANDVDTQDTQQVANTVVRHVTTTLARQAANLDELAAYQATALSVRDQLLKRWNETTTYHTRSAPKRVYYLSIEWLMGRSLDNAVLNLDMRNTYETATQKLGFVSHHRARPQPSL